MRVGYLNLENEDFIIMTSLQSVINDKVLPYIYAFKSSNDLTYVRSHDDFISYINELIDKKVKLDIYMYDLSELYYQIVNLYECYDVTLKRKKALKFSIGRLTFRSIQSLLASISEEDFVGMTKPLHPRVITPDTRLEERGCNWVREWIDHSLPVEYDFIKSVRDAYGKPISSADIIKTSLAKSCNGDLYYKLQSEKRKLDDEFSRSSLFDKMNTYRKNYLGYKGFESNFINTDHYLFARDCFRGGLNYYNPKFKCKHLKNVLHYDEVSCYIRFMFSKRFPMKRIGIYYNQTNLVNIKNDIDPITGEVTRYKWAMLKVRLKDVSPKSNFTPLVLPNDNKPQRYLKYSVQGTDIIDDSYLGSANTVILNCTYDELRYFLAYYNYSSLEILIADVYEAHYLPLEFVRIMMQLYYEKRIAKDKFKSGDVEEWVVMFRKALLASCWGYTGSGFYNKDVAQDVLDYNHFSKGFADRVWSYFWGVAITSYARIELYNGISICGDNLITSDTDSLFTLYSEDIESRMNKLNKSIKEEVCKSPYFHIFDEIVGDLGLFKREETLEHFVCYGSKCYIGHTGSKFEKGVSRCFSFRLQNWFNDTHLSIDAFFDYIAKENLQLDTAYGFNKFNKFAKEGDITIDGKVYKCPDGIYTKYTKFRFGSPEANSIEIE